jgi:hypothetical protein
MTGIHKQGGGPSGNCICLKCGTKVPHQAATPWRSFLPARPAMVEACENVLDNCASKEKSFHYHDLLEGV